MTPHQWKHVGVQALRRCVQVSVVLLVAGLVYLSLYAHYRAARALDDLEAMPGVQGAVLRTIDDRVSSLNRPEAFLDGYKGTLWSMRLGGYDLSDPLAAVELIAASKRVHGPMMLSIVVPVLLTFILGRVFCSWLCPGYLLFEVGGKLRRLLRLAEISPAEVPFSRTNKYVFLGVGVLVAAIVSRPLFALIYPPAVISRLLHAWIFGTVLTGMLAILGVVLLFEVLISPRWFCRTLCPGGALLGLIGAVRPLRVLLDPDRCTRCRECEPVCEQGLDPVAESAGIECDNCGECVRACPERALTYRLTLPGFGRGGAQPSAAALLFWLALVVLLLQPFVARAHHILGLPHYAYKENYPQVPTLEYPAATGPYDVLLTSYPGKPVPGQTANLSFYIKDRTSGEPYAGPVSVRVLQTFTFGRNRVLLGPIEVQPFDRIHKLASTFDVDGEFVVELSLEVEGVPEVIPFQMVVGSPSSVWSVVIPVGAGLVLFLIVIRAVRIKRERRASDAQQPVAGQGGSCRVG